MGSRPSLAILDRFWANVNKDGPVVMAELGPCWQWIGRVGQSGYGLFQIGRHTRLTAHRFAWELANGPVPAGLLACHKCDNRRCINQNHIFIGTHKDNSQDMSRKGRTWRHTHPESHEGESGGNNKLTAAQVTTIRRRLAAGESHISISRDYPVGYTQIGNIARGEAWASLLRAVA